MTNTMKKIKKGIGQKSGQVLQTRQQGYTLSEEVRPERPCIYVEIANVNRIYAETANVNLKMKANAKVQRVERSLDTRQEKTGATNERIKVFYDKPIIYLHIIVPFMNFG